MKYISTRGTAPTLTFEEAVLAGLASDGGLYVPENLPQFSPAEIADMAGLSYEDLMLKLITPFIEDEISQDVLRNIIQESYATFSNTAIAPLKQIGNQQFILELFHGPTLAFKDFALQFLGRIFDHILAKRNENVVIVGATSGDTGSAAIEGCRHSKHVKMFILHPHERVSNVQRKQMTTVIQDNVHNLAVQGSFDDCQHIVKELFKDQSFLDNKTQLVAVNSINWCRIMAQIVYYFYAGLQLGSPARPMTFSVPTGNFGDIFAGYLAYKMGLPIRQLIVATNQNDILHRFFANNDYSKGDLIKTLSPSMDIQVSSNFERLLFYMHDCCGAQVAKIMDTLHNNGGISVENHRLNSIRDIFSSYSADDKDACDTILSIYNACGELIDPHTAIGVKAAQECVSNTTTPTITLATAHPAKFPEAIQQAGIAQPDLPSHMQDLMDRPEKYQEIPNNLDAIKALIIA